jgi:thiamine biosynthesis protein ThiS
MRIRVNGNDREVDDNIPLVRLMEQLGLKPQATVVERNGGIVERSCYGDIILAEGDELELVRFVGGG